LFQRELLPSSSGYILAVKVPLKQPYISARLYYVIFNKAVISIGIATAYFYFADDISLRNVMFILSHFF